MRIVARDARQLAAALQIAAALMQAIGMMIRLEPLCLRLRITVLDDDEVVAQRLTCMEVVDAHAETRHAAGEAACRLQMTLHAHIITSFVPELHGIHN